jgi:hypothetical protein
MCEIVLLAEDPIEPFFEQIINPDLKHVLWSYTAELVYRFLKHRYNQTCSEGIYLYWVSWVTFRHEFGIFTLGFVMCFMYEYFLFFLITDVLEVHGICIIRNVRKKLVYRHIW